MKKKNKIILGSVIAICILGLVCSIFIDWPVDINDADVDIDKLPVALKNYILSLRKEYGIIWC